MIDVGNVSIVNFFSQKDVSFKNSQTPRRDFFFLWAEKYWKEKREEAEMLVPVD